ncbi:MAG: HEAT repeat domain-containing protein [Anditalea sp.]
MKKAFKAIIISRIYPIFFLISLLVLLACRQEPVDKRIKQMDPEKAAQLVKSIEGLVNPEIAEGLTLNLWAGDSLVADPISINVDDRGRVYYSKTNRRKISEFDIRSHPDWEIESIKMQSVEARREFLHRELSPENSDKNQWLPDINGDGSRDWRDLTVEKENVFRLEDTNGDGIADMSQLVVEDFNEEVTDVAGALLVQGEEVFVGVAPDLWRMKDTNGDGVVDEKTSISHGYGVHIGFGGHNMSGLEMGPDGRIYWGIGDIGFNGVGPDGTEWKYPNRGVIARSNPDGSDFEVFAMGVRNTHEFVFDEYANLISVDNDGDHGGESERLVYIVNGSDSGWRINWQFGKYRDPLNNSYKVWMEEELYKPRFEGQAAYITPPVASFVNGPTGMLYNPGTALAPRWKNTFFVAEFVGNPARSGIHSFKLEPKGATFELAEQSKILGGILATGLDFGPDGAMYVADWIDGWVNKEFGRIWKLDDGEGDSWPERLETQKILAENLQDRESQELGELLKYPDMRVRQKAQFELARRGEEGAGIFEENISQTGHQLARVHGIIGLGQLARLEDMSYAEPLLPLLEDTDPEIRAQAAKWLGDIKYKDAGEALLPLLEDGHSRVRFFAAEALGRIGHEPAISGLVELLASNNDGDAYIRHAASLALARMGKAEPVLALAGHPSAAVRLGAVLALRRMSLPGIARFLEDEDEYIVTEAARAINDDFSIEGALPALGNVLRDPRFTDEALLRRAINANLRVGSGEALQNLIDYSGLESAPLAMRTEALEALGTWARPSVLDRVDGRYRGEIERDLSPVKAAAADRLIGLLSHHEAEIRLHSARVIGKLGISAAVSGLLSLLKGDSDAEVRVASLGSLAALEGGHKDQAIKQALSDRDKEVRVAGLDLLNSLDIPRELVVDLLWEVIEKRGTEEKQAAVLNLGSVPLENSRPVFEGLLGQLESGSLPREIHLELSEAIEETGSDELSERYRAYSSGLSPDSLAATYQGSLYGGDAGLGRRVFFRHQSGQCVRCHAYDDMGGSAGPMMNGIASKLSRQELLEALIDPGKRLAPGFGLVTLELDNGRTVSGVLGEETGDGLSLKMGNSPDTVILKSDIAERREAPSSMPDMKGLLTRREIRDLVSFLATLEEEEE